MIRFAVNDRVNKEYLAVWLNSTYPRLFVERNKIGAIQAKITQDVRTRREKAKELRNIVESEWEKTNN